MAENRQKAAAVLRDVFRLTNRGTVLVVGQIDGTVNIGDRLVFADRETRVIGIEMVDFSDVTARGSGSVGLLIHDADDSSLRDLIGQPTSFYGKD